MTKLLFNIDDAIADSLSKWIFILKQRFPQKVPPNFSPSDTGPFVPSWEEWGLSWQEYQSPILEPGFYRNLDPTPGAIESIRFLQDHDFEIIFVSIPPKESSTAAREKELWLRENLPSVSPNNIVFLRRTELLRGDCLVDNKPFNLFEFSGKRLLFDPQKHYREEESMLLFEKKIDARVCLWNDVIKKIMQFFGEEKF